MNNYDKMLEAARLRFLEYDINRLAKRACITDSVGCLATRFLGQLVQISKSNGQILLDGRPAGFGECLTIYDWLCDAKPDAMAAWEFCQIASLPGILVRGGNLVLNCDILAEKIDKKPNQFVAVCEDMDGKQIHSGDIGIALMAFPDLPLQMKFYHSDEEFPATMTLLWDRNTLQFLRYETVYYLAGCLLRRIDCLMA